MSSAPQLTRHHEFRRDVEGLRGVAVLLVVLYHAGVERLGGGFIGVDVFFVISGYLITGLLAKEIESSGTVDLVRFYARRARRLLPAALLVVAVTLAVSFLVFAPFEQTALAKTGLSTTLYCSNLWFAREATNYFGADAHQNPFLHTWSLAVEEQFYLLWPVLLLIAARFARPFRSRRALVLMMSAVSAASFALCVWLTNTRQPWAFFSSPARAWEFGIGGLAALRAGNSRVERFRWLPWFGLAAVAASAIMLRPTSRFPGFAAMGPVLGTVAIVVFRERQAGGAMRLLHNSTIQLLGRLSYSWYLWHWPVLVFATLRWHLGVRGRLLCAALSLVVAAIANRLVENPIRFSPYLVKRSGLSLRLALGLTFCTSVLCLAVGATAKYLQNSPTQAPFTEAYNDFPQVYSDGCHAGYENLDSPECVFGDKAARRAIVLFGDSHAAEWFPALEQMAEQRHIRLFSFTKSGCPAASVRIYDLKLRRYYNECEQWRDRTLRRIAAIQPETVFIASYTSDYLKRGVTPKQWQTGLRVTLSHLDLAGVEAILIHDPPVPGFDVCRCLARASWTKQNQKCDFQRDLRNDEKIAVLETQASAGARAASVIDLSPEVCRGTRCSPVRNGVIEYRDEDHFTATFSRSLTPAIERLLASDQSHRTASAALR